MVKQTIHLVLMSTLPINVMLGVGDGDGDDDGGGVDDDDELD